MRRTTASTCCYCGVGCGVLIEHDADTIHGVTGDPAHPANYGRLCSKGSTLHKTGDPAARALYPELRLGKGMARSRTDWDTAMQHAARVFGQTITDFGPDSVAFYISGQLLTEDYYAFNKLARAVVGTNNIDSNSRLCMSSAVVGYKQSLGADSPPCSYEDIEQSDCLLIIGSNMAYAHPVLFRRLEQAKSLDPAKRIIVVDPRRTATCELADVHLGIQPGTDVALLHGILNLLIQQDWIDETFIQTHTGGFDALQSLVGEYTPEHVAGICGIDPEALRQVAQMIGTAPSFLSLWCMGMNQSSAGSAKNSALINLHLATGKIGKPGSGPFSLTGQPNAMGGRETGSLSNLLPGHRDATNAKDRAEVADYWGIEALPDSPGLSAIELFEAVRRGKIKALWIACTNPAQSMPDQTLIREALALCPFVVVQEAFATTETCQFADLLLPASSWGEKNGTVTNSERRVSRVRSAIPAPGEARADWAIACDFAQRLEKQLKPDQPSVFGFHQPQTLFDEFRGLTAKRDLDYSGLSYQLLDALGPQQWPFLPGAERGTARLYADKLFPTIDGRARFIADTYKTVKEQQSTDYPLILNTGRLRDQWHGMSRTGTAAQLFGHVDQAQISLNPADIDRLELHDGQLVRVTSRRGKLVLPVVADEQLQAGQAYIPMHWGDRFLRGGGVNVLTQPAFDPMSGQPELKQAAIRIEPVSLPWDVFILVEGDIQARFSALRDLFEDLAYASFSLAGREEPALLIRAANEQPRNTEWLAEVDLLLGLDQVPVLAYDDPHLAVSKRIKIEGSRIRAVRLCGETKARDWLINLWRNGESTENLQRWLLAPLSAPPGATAASVEKIICNCVNVSHSRIQAAINSGMNLDSLKAELGCGTECGSCLPEIRRLLPAPNAPASTI
ncbi:nitrate reductase [Halopseudomonas salina]|uniref:Assimilatory nitrate reductase n=1 Tax=Halopseudomonas salina TaxID=1323744 RepID=A0ABQ1P4T2_9GAMM|nr:nitrate reductase [Halopseudomonas salina]GGC90297.1 assimilatory nitrate reductase [Halopseudomonas salina]